MAGSTRLAYHSGWYDMEATACGDKEQSEEIMDEYRNLVSIVYKVVEAFRERYAMLFAV